MRTTPEQSQQEHVVREKPDDLQVGNLAYMFRKRIRLRIVSLQKSWSRFLTAPFPLTPCWIKHYVQEIDPHGAILSG